MRSKPKQLLGAAASVSVVVDFSLGVVDFGPRKAGCDLLLLVVAAGDGFVVLVLVVHSAEQKYYSPAPLDSAVFDLHFSWIADPSRLLLDI